MKDISIGGLLGPEQSERFIELLKKHEKVFAEHPPKYFCSCGTELEVVGHDDESGRPEFAPHDHGEPDPDFAYPPSVRS